LKEQLLISICIPTYNRRKLIKGLLLQLNDLVAFSFEVVVVNDGSSDDTRECLKTISNELKYPLRVFHQQNMGRASALKMAVMAANGEVLIIMDDDDQFIMDSLEQLAIDIKHHLNIGKSKRPIAGLVYLANDILDNNLIGTPFPCDDFVSNLIAIRADHSVKGDKKEVIRRTILQGVMYTVPNEERRMPTSVLWARVAEKYDVICKNRALIQKQYLTGGLSKNITNNRVENPIASMKGYFEIITMSNQIFNSRLYRMRNSINYFRFYFHIKNRFSIFYFLFAGTIGWMASIYDRLIIGLKK